MHRSYQYSQHFGLRYCNKCTVVVLSARNTLDVPRICTVVCPGHCGLRCIMGWHSPLQYRSHSCSAASNGCAAHETYGANRTRLRLSNEDTPLSYVYFIFFITAPSDKRLYLLTDLKWAWVHMPMFDVLHISMMTPAVGWARVWAHCYCSVSSKTVWGGCDSAVRCRGWVTKLPVASLCCFLSKMLIHFS